MWRKLCLMSFLILFVPAVFAQNETVNETAQGEYLVVRIEAWVTNVSYWCKGEGTTRYELFGGIAECQEIEEKRECRCTISLPDDQMPEFFLAYEQIEKRYDEKNSNLIAEIGSLWFWIDVTAAVAFVSVVSMVIISKYLPKMRLRLS